MALGAFNTGSDKTQSFDTAPRQGSSNPVTSDGIYEAISDLQDELREYTQDAVVWGSF